MIRSDYSSLELDAVQAPGASAPFPVAAVRRPLARARTATHARPPRRERQPAVRARRRRGRLGQEPARPRVRPRGGRAWHACPLRRLRRGRAAPVPAVRRGARAARADDRADDSASGPRPGRGRAHPPAARPRAPRRRAAAAGRRRAGHRAPPPARRGRRPARRRRSPRPARGRRRGRPLGRRRDAPPLAPPRARRRRRPRARGHNVPRHRGRRAPLARGRPRRPPPLRGRRADAPHGPHRRRDRRVRRARRRRRHRPRPGDGRRGPPRPHRRQRVPRDRAVADAARDRHDADGRRRPPRRRARRAGQPRGRARGRRTGGWRRPGPARRAAALAGLGSPEGVREVVGQRLDRLTAATTALLELAAVAGPEFDLTVVARAGVPGAALPGAVEQAVAHGMIEEVPARRLAYRFTHELVRRALYDRMAGLRRAELHLRVGEALEQCRDGGNSRGLADLAHHFAEAVPVDGPRRAVDYALLAGSAALETPALHQGGGRLPPPPRPRVPDPRRRGETQLELGTARLRAGRDGDAMEAFRAAAQIAREIDDPHMLATAAVGFEEGCWRPGITDAGAVELLREASDALGDDDSALRVMLLAGLGRAHSFVGEHAESKVVREQATAMARRLDDRLGLATVLMRCYWSRSDERLEDTIEMLDEACGLAAGLSNSELEAEAMEWRVAALMDLGDLERAAREHATVH